ncbi:MAG: Gfo/Idh/MocA family oxidoreductase [Actinobacteria bacterium]|nr:Gfo/Idh/MocA family oxidoreductase [Cyanobacteriota bacterium]MCL5770820.1 Gfo/Idh/MocA family oxidoreductase [Actinomycetota bacterium]
MEKVKICLVGAGRAGEVHGDVYKFSIPDAEIVSVFDTDLTKAKNLASKFNLDKTRAFTNFDDAIKNVDFDAIVITTPTFTHRQYTEIAAANKKHVFCEKPMCITLEDCDKMIEACKKANVILQIGFMRRFDDGFKNGKQLLMEGEIGQPLIIKSVGRGPGLPGKWAYDIKNSNGTLAEVNSHDFDSIRWLAESDYKVIYSVAKNSKNPEIGKEYPDFYDNATVLATLNNEVFGVIDSVCPCDYGYDARVEIVGTKGVIFIGYLKEHTTITCTRNKGCVSPQVLSWKKRFHEAYIAEDRHFIECILDNKTPIVTGKDGKHAVKAVIAANESIKKGMPVNL